MTVIAQSFSNDASLSLLTVMRSLLFRPFHLMEAYAQEQIKTRQIWLYNLIFLVFASLLFAITSILHFPSSWHLQTWQLVLRFFALFGFTLFFAIPFITLIWSILQAFSTWFLSIKIPLVKLFSITGLGIFYYALIFAISLPVFILLPSNGLTIQIILAALNITGFILSVRLLKTAYQVWGEVSFKKALLTALLPIAIIATILILTRLLTYFAMAPHLHG